MSKALLMFGVLVVVVAAFLLAMPVMPLVENVTGTVNGTANIENYEGLRETVNATPALLLLLMAGVVIYGFYKFVKWLNRHTGDQND